MTGKQKKIMIMAGGTGGHVFPGLAVAEKLEQMQHQVRWLGTRSGIEARLVPAAGIAIDYIDIAGVRGKGLAGLVLAPWRISKAMVQSLAVLRREKPNCVLGMGGFVAGPGAIAARLLGINVIIHEQNAKAGTTNRVLSCVASRVLQAFPGTFPTAAQALTVGNPVRENLACKKQEGQDGAALKILILGGSLGAQAINQIMPQLAEAMRVPLAIWHQTGKGRDVDVKMAYGASVEELRVDAFIDDMAKAYHWADLVICRAGAMTVSEIAAVGLPAIFIPYPYAIDDHQSANANWLANAGAAVVIQQKDLTVKILQNMINDFYRQRDKLRTMGEKAATLAIYDAALTVATECLENAR